MTKFRYFIIDLDSGTVGGTNDSDLVEKAKEEATDQFAFIDVEGGTYTSPSMEDELFDDFVEDGDGDEDDDGPTPDHED
jgi:hypothetical protein